jgi:hypothetical protein
VGNLIPKIFNILPAGQVGVWANVPEPIFTYFLFLFFHWFGFGNFNLHWQKIGNTQKRLKHGRTQRQGWRRNWTPDMGSHIFHVFHGINHFVAFQWSLSGLWKISFWQDMQALKTM